MIKLTQELEEIVQTWTTLRSSKFENLPAHSIDKIELMSSAEYRLV
jgi:hypothetical protein